MVRGTTPIHTFSTNTDLSRCRVYVTYKQDSRTIVEKTNEDMNISRDGILVTLTQAETLRFKANRPVEIQARYVDEYGTACASNIVTTTVEEVLKGGII
jgi:hypothetical protein